MRKIMIVSLLLSFGLAAGGLAASSGVDTTWDFYSGWLNISFDSSDDASISLNTGGGHAWGSFLGTDYDDNPHKYNVDTARAQVRAWIEGGGGIQFRMDRLDSWASMYGGPGQYTSTEIFTSDGTAFFATNTRTNFADMITHNYGFQEHDQYSASGSEFGIFHEIYGAADRFAGLSILGSGSAIVTLMSDEARAGGWRFGEGAGCYVNAKASGTGSGTFTLYGTAPNGLNLPFGAGTIPGGSFNFVIDYLNGFNFTNINSRGW